MLKNGTFLDSEAKNLSKTSVRHNSMKIVLSSVILVIMDFVCVGMWMDGCVGMSQKTLAYDWLMSLS